jgi:hypothetical protein
MPELEHQERPERLPMVADSTLVLTNPSSHLIGVEKPLPS